MCNATLANGPLTCVRIETHVSGHVYQSLTGSWVPDGHADGGQG